MTYDDFNLNIKSHRGGYYSFRTTSDIILITDNEGDNSMSNSHDREALVNDVQRLHDNEIENGVARLARSFAFDRNEHIGESVALEHPNPLAPILPERNYSPFFVSTHNQPLRQTRIIPVYSVDSEDEQIFTP